MNWKADYEKKKMSVDEAAKLIKSGDVVWATPNNNAPYTLLNAVGARYKELKDVKLAVQLLIKPLNCFIPEAKGHIDVFTGFKGPGERAGEKTGWKVDTAAFQLHRHDELMLNVIKANVGLMQVTPPNEEGYCYLGCNPTGVTEIFDTAELIIAQVNKNNPIIPNENLCVHVSQFDAIVEVDEEILVSPNIEPSDLDKQVAAHIVERIPNGATIQIGIGGIANAVGYSLENHKDLGVHTELYVEAMYYLTKKGAINNSKKTLYPGKAVIGFASGSKEMYDFLHNNPNIINREIQWVNNPVVVAQNDNFVSLNACLGVDLLGQVSSESIGFRQFSGTGGQLDFVRGAQKSKNGMSFLAMQSVVEKKDGSRISKITLTHAPGSAITVPRTDVQYVCTEYGIVNLQNQSIDYRARALISIAHPDFRDELEFEAKKAGIII
ncbi:MAG: 4-hydroxybutyrate CoA-transferase [Eubacteriaceae bacterium]|jgi:4-hydroxybutyrate CoA-transferase|nr:4-hydroxybutyrate CoA-transferase [Eubacteriaceae bacterium]